MGREVKRVSLDFNWPMNVVWKGYLSPYRFIECKPCGGSGLNVETRKIEREWYRLDDPSYDHKSYKAWCYNLDKHDIKALLDADRLWDFTRVPRTKAHELIIKKKIENGENSWLPFSNGYVPTPEEVNAWARTGLGHDGINSWICVKAKAKRLGVYGECYLCKGEGGYYPDDRFIKLAEEWEGIEPPEGEGYQMWETTSEGSPISPVFETPEKLARWLSDNNASIFGRSTTTYENWLAMIEREWAPSAIMSGGKMKSGVNACSDQTEAPND